MTPERSLLANLPEVSRIDENSEEFQEVVKNFYGSIKGYHSKIRIVKVGEQNPTKTLIHSKLLTNIVSRCCALSSRWRNWGIACSAVSTS